MAQWLMHRVQANKLLYARPS